MQAYPRLKFLSSTLLLFTMLYEVEDFTARTAGVSKYHNRRSFLPTTCIF